MILDRDKLANDLASIYIRTIFQEYLSDEDIDQLVKKKCKIYKKVYNILANMEDEAYDFSDTTEFLRKYYSIREDRTVD